MFTNSVDSDKMLHNAVCHHGLHCVINNKRYVKMKIVRNSNLCPQIMNVRIFLILYDQCGLNVLFVKAMVQTMANRI